MKKHKYILIVTLTIVLLSTVSCVLLNPPSQEMPILSVPIIEETIKHDGIERSYLFYKPKDLEPSPPLVIVLHRAKSTGGQMRELTGYDFDKIADRNKFIVVYPDGYEGNWNDCRKSAKDSAHALNIDDVGFINALIESFAKKHGIDRSRVLLTGLSNGGHMCFRLAIELSEKISAVAAIAAHVPVQENNICHMPDIPVSILLVSGTEDPINPFEGGEVSILGLIKKGQVLSSIQSAEFWLKAYGLKNVSNHTIFPDKNPDDKSWIERQYWDNKSGIEINLYTVHGGGHTIPGTKQNLSFFWGSTNQDISMTDEIINFFYRVN